MGLIRFDESPLPIRAGNVYPQDEGDRPLETKNLFIATGHPPAESRPLDPPLRAPPGAGLFSPRWRFIYLLKPGGPTHES
jgi:hypothetical protein